MSKLESNVTDVQQEQNRMGNQVQIKSSQKDNTKCPYVDLGSMGETKLFEEDSDNKEKVIKTPKQNKKAHLLDSVLEVEERVGTPSEYEDTNMSLICRASDDEPQTSPTMSDSTHNEDSKMSPMDDIMEEDARSTPDQPALIFAASLLESAFRGFDRIL